MGDIVHTHATSHELTTSSCKRVSSFITDATDDKGHYRTENCTKQEAPPGGYKRQTIISQILPRPVG